MTLFQEVSSLLQGIILAEFLENKEVAWLWLCVIVVFGREGSPTAHMFNCLCSGEVHHLFLCLVRLMGSSNIAGAGPGSLLALGWH